ncbi:MULTISPECIES: hypothetical protein [Streptomyces]|uniref:hypothetical protein n=1 Tax=Streptomyces TaxID=1883 RepID=UPI001674845A|nr:MULTISPECIES: hypothetical protein [Streptomyces]MBK3522734.1 hypothetical protein [Streptomyces sp. MBT70]GGR58430.1 hypothetical protein GCM10010236_08530 [Streptomyces eurythermus]
MGKIMLSRLTVTLAVAAVVGLALPGVAGAVDGSTELRTNTACNDGKATAVENVAIRTSTSTSAALVTTALKGQTWACGSTSVILGGRYTACGTTNGNGWFYVYNDNYAGYTASGCWG